ncbi:zinc ribbon domain-containing protein [Entomospira culicis]|uniref:Transcriptional regulator n=1 Tax=Entomospira culicis TaxID=2719989 RepID=A0A968GHQ4_9SPIO|nr:zinc ribbon domain-containing protein [Entomospira culicis]NIZ18635.1 transcriptional regulator [Entomospira culicis]NIZ68850.1 transcriptional regulator [Entomospira culicis]WDI37444.1 zinc ribbon domain-containing protein [Entomospira culicis]WDI39072.1 zinc ribbon domain-containing protein [Entomospira culicis]
MVANYCQSCGIPMGEEKSFYGTHHDGSSAEDYCHHCFKDGSFIHDLTLDQMMRISLIYLSEVHPELSKEEAEQRLRESLPKLKRWQ